MHVPKTDSQVGRAHAGQIEMSPYRRSHGRHRHGRGHGLAKCLHELPAWIKIAIVATLFYSGTYVFLSAGGYWEGSSGGYMVWTPYGASRGSFLSFVFAPITAVDRIFVHRTPSLGTPEHRDAKAQERSRLEEERRDRLGYPASDA